MKKRLLLLIIAIGVLIYIGWVLYFAVSESSKNPIVMEKNTPKDYLNLFSETVKNKLILDLGTSFKLRNNVSIFIYDDRYKLELTKINLKPGFQLGRDLVEIYNNKPGGSFSGNEWSFNEPDFTTKYEGSSNESTSKIYLSLDGDSIRTVVKNDSIVCFQLKLKDVYVNYQPNGFYEISIESKIKTKFFGVKKARLIVLFAFIIK